MLRIKLRKRKEEKLFRVKPEVFAEKLRYLRTTQTKLK